jgi:hypothetical protein
VILFVYLGSIFQAGKQTDRSVDERSSERDVTPPKKKYRRLLHSSSRSSSLDSNSGRDSGSDSGGYFPSPNKRILRKAFYAKRDEAAYWRKQARKKSKKSKRKSELQTECYRNQVTQQLLDERRLRTVEDIARL